MDRLSQNDFPKRRAGTVFELAIVSLDQYPGSNLRTSYLEYDSLDTFYDACCNKIIQTNSVLESIVESLRKYILCDNMSEKERDLIFGGKSEDVFD